MVIEFFAALVIHFWLVVLVGKECLRHKPTDKLPFATGIQAQYAIAPSAEAAFKNPARIGLTAGCCTPHAPTVRDFIESLEADDWSPFFGVVIKLFLHLELIPSGVMRQAVSAALPPSILQRGSL